MSDLTRRIAVARGDERADLLLRNGRVIDVFGGEVLDADVAVVDGWIAGIGPDYDAVDSVDLGGRYVCPGLVDAHVHIESAMVPPSEFAAAVVPHGVTCAITDPHEIANVLGIDGIRYMLRDAEQAPMSIYVNAPSCVPATHLSTNGARLEADDLAALLGEPRVLGLAEVMNYPGVVAADEKVLAKLQRFSGRAIDGHSPGLDGKALNAYLAAGMQSDHECTNVDEARRKLQRGMTIFIREGSVAHDLRPLLSLITPANERRFCFCTDDRVPSDLLDEGSIDHVVRLAIEAGLDPLCAIRIATIHAAEHFGLRDHGAVAPGRRADIVVFSDLDAPRAEQVYVGGKLVAEAGRLVVPRPSATPPPPPAMNVDLDAVRLDVPRGDGDLRVIGVIPDQLLTESLRADPKVENGFVVADPASDTLKLAVIERHAGTGNVGLAFVRGMGLQRGALAGTVAHDHHNLLVVGVDDASMMTAARAVVETGGGFAAADGQDVLGTFPLPIAGLLSDLPVHEATDRFREVLSAARRLGATPQDPFMTLSFLGLEVIPTLKLTDQGLVDVERMQVVPLFA